MQVAHSEYREPCACALAERCKLHGEENGRANFETAVSCNRPGPAGTLLSQMPKAFLQRDWSSCWGMGAISECAQWPSGLGGPRSAADSGEKRPSMQNGTTPQGVLVAKSELQPSPQTSLLSGCQSQLAVNSKELAGYTQWLEQSGGVLKPAHVTVSLLVSCVLVSIPDRVAAITVRLLWIGR